MPVIRTTKEQQNDWDIASSICRKHPNKKCLDAAIELMDHFCERATVIYICTINKALCLYICHNSLPDDVISETGKHWAVMLHEKVFDNLHSQGETLEQWLLGFEYANKNNKTAHFIKDDIEWWTHKDLIRYLKGKRKRQNSI